MFSVQIPNLTNTNSAEMRRLTMQFMREVNLKVRVMEQEYESRIRKLEKELRQNGE